MLCDRCVLSHTHDVGLALAAVVVGPTHLNLYKGAHYTAAILREVTSSQYLTQADKQKGSEREIVCVFVRSSSAHKSVNK